MDSIIMFVLNHPLFILGSLAVIVIVLTITPLAIRGDRNQSVTQAKVYPGHAGYKKPGVG